LANLVERLTILFPKGILSKDNAKILYPVTIAG